MGNIKFETVLNRVKDSSGVVSGAGIDDRENPIFNFSNKFIQDMQCISSPDLGQLVPYISIQAIDLKGEVIQDFNMNFFQKQIDMDKIKEKERYSDRPEMSLISCEIKTGQEGGYLYTKNIVLVLKLHKPAMLMSQALISFLFPGAPLKVTYGWSGPSKSSINNMDLNFLTQKETFYMNVMNYSINLNINGEADLTVNGMCFNNIFDNIYVGDVGKTPDPALQSTVQIADGIEYNYNKVQKYIQYVNKIKNTAQKNAKDFKIIKENAEPYYKAEQITRGAIAKNFATLWQRLTKLNLWQDVTHDVGGKKITLKYVSVRDFIEVMCTDTLNNMSGRIFPDVGAKGKYRFIFGLFNEETERSSGIKRIEEFLLPKKDLEVIFKENLNSKKAPTMKFLFNKIISMMKNDKYWKTYIKGKKEFQEPDVVFLFESWMEGSGDTKKDYIDIYLIDSKSCIPPTTKTVSESKNDDEIEKTLSAKGIPIIKFGHSYSFIKNISFTHVMDESMKTVLLGRMYDSVVFSPRDPTINQEVFKQSPDTALTLPLQGTMEVLGHVSWKPFRAFYIKTGLYLIDGVYRILDVTHKLSQEGFTTSITFMYN